MSQEERIQKLLYGLKKGNCLAVSYFSKRANVDLNGLYRMHPYWFHMFDPCFDEMEGLTRKRRSKLINLFYQLHEQGQIDVNTQDVFGDTVLHLLTKIGEGEFAKILVDKGANVNLLNDRGETPLSLAVFRGDYSLAAYFIDEGQAQAPPQLLQQFAELVEQQPQEMQALETLSFLKNYARVDVDAFKDEYGDTYTSQIIQRVGECVAKQKGVVNERVKRNY